MNEVTKQGETVYLNKFVVASTLALCTLGLSGCSGNNHSPEIQQCWRLWESEWSDVGFTLDYESERYEDLGNSKGRITLSAWTDSDKTELWYGTCSADGAKVETADQWTEEQ